jgi:peptide-methionine (S)-S-oxide reductase
MNTRLLNLALVSLMTFSAFSCTDAAHAGASVPKPARDVATTTPPGQLKTAVLAGGCFWASEEAFDQLAGVADVVSGYAGGTAETANYEEYTKSNHAEAVEIKYDPSKISYGKLLQVLFSFIDPTQVDAQGPDIGHGYRSAIFYATPEEKAVAEAYIKQLNAAKVFPDPIATTVEPLEKFYPAESFHQNYLKDPNHRQESYVQSVSLHKVEKVRTAFKGDLKPDAVK